MISRNETWRRMQPESIEEVIKDIENIVTMIGL